MKRTKLLLISILFAAALAAAALVSVAASAHAGSPAARAAASATVQLRKTGLGKILVSSSGRTLYAFSRDSRDSDSCVKVKGCPEFWPAQEVHGKPSAGSGARGSLLSTVKLPKGKTQVAYAGHPLYLYSGDNGPGQTAYVGAKQFGGTWYAVNAAGQLVK